MNSIERIEQRLREIEAPEAPASLGDRIRGEIPANLAAIAAPRKDPGARWWQVAAALALMIGGGWLAWTWQQDPTAPRATVARNEHATVPRSERATDENVPPPNASTDARRSSAATAAESPVDGAPGTPSDRPLTFDDVAGTRAGNARDPIASKVYVGTEGDLEAMSVDVRMQAGSVPPAPPAQVTAAPAQRVAREMQVEGKVRGILGGATGDARTESAVRMKTVMSPASAPLPPPSTGGTAEPNDQPYGDVFFKTYGTNPFIDTEDDALSTFGLDVDTGSWGVARRYLSDGHLPPAEAIRVEEILNSFRYGDRAPLRDDFAVYSDAAPWPFARGERYHALRFGIRSRDVSAANRKAATLIFTVDVSGSMAREDRLELVKRALYLLIDQLDERDRIGLVVYGTNGEVLLEPTSDHGAIRRAIDRLSPEGSTNAEEGLILAYKLAGAHFRRGEINRVILCSDGVANVGRTGPESILESIGEWARRGIELTTVGFGMGNYNDVLMEQLADRGNGQYAYVDSLAEARKVFVENLTATLQTIARDTKVQVEFEPSAVARYRLLGYENRDIADERFRDDSVDAGEIGAGHAVTALYEIKLQPHVGRNERIATLRLRYKDVDNGDRVREIEHPVYARDIVPEWREAPRALRLATLVATFGEMLKQSYWTKDVDPALLARRIDALAAEMRSPEVDELAALAGRAVRLMERRRPVPQPE